MGSNVVDPTMSAAGKTNARQLDLNRRRRDSRDVGMEIDRKNPPPAEVRDQFEQTPYGWKPKGDAVMKDFSEKKTYDKGGIVTIPYRKLKRPKRTSR